MLHRDHVGWFQAGDEMTTAFIFGLGFTGMTLAKLLRDAGWQVRGSKRSSGPLSGPLSGHDIGEITIYPFSTEQPIKAIDDALDGVTHVVSMIPAENGIDPVLTSHGESLRRLGAWAGYVSATSVYRESGGGWVNEDSSTEPQSERGRVRRQAEILWQDTLSAEVFRAAGIYGPGRSPFQALLNGKARIINKPGHLFNRIHVEDLAKIIMTAMLNPAPQRVLNCADGNPCEAGEVTRYASSLLGVEPPEAVNFADANLSEMAQSFYATARCVDNSRLRTALGLELDYPDYKSGLESVLAAEQRLGLLCSSLA